MRLERWTRALIVAALSGVLLTAGLAQAQEEQGIIRGMVYGDVNGNGVFDAGEMGIEGALLVLSSGDRLMYVTTTEIGTFRAEVPAGTWHIALAVPEGYRPVDYTNRSATIDADGTLEAVMNFPLLPPGSAPVGAPATPVPTAPVILPATGAAWPLSATLFVALALMLLLGLGLLAIGRRAASH